MEHGYLTVNMKILKIIQGGDINLYMIFDVYFAGDGSGIA